MLNPNPKIFSNVTPRSKLKFKNGILQNISESTIYELVRDIQDPEHPQTLEQLNVVSLENIRIFNDEPIYKIENKIRNMETKITPNMPIYEYGLPIKNIEVYFKPTIPHCSMASFIGLSIKSILMKYIPSYYYIKVLIVENTHSQYLELNKQLNDKDRILAALENENLKEIIEGVIPFFDDSDTS